MTEEIKNVNAKIDEAEAAIKKYASKDTVISIGGYEFTPAKLMVAFTLASSLLGGLYGCFEVYKDYQSMKKKIADYSAPDLSGFDKRLAVIEETIGKTNDYTRDIKNDLKGDIRRTESVTEQVERYVKDANRQSDSEIRDMRKGVHEDLDKERAELQAMRQENAQLRKEVTSELNSTKKEITREVDTLKREVDSKIQKAVDNPLANK
jgi:molecular chaperone DnaK (HSP70)